MTDQTHIWALGGESHTAPENTMPAYWAALGSGADGLAIGVRLTSDGVVVCCDRENLRETCGEPRKVSKVTAEELRSLDAGSMFQSTVLDDKNQPAGNGEDIPWTGQGKHRSQWLYHPTLSDVLVLFSRRTDLLLFLRPNGSSDKARKEIVDAVAKLLVKFGLDRSTLLAVDAETLPQVAKILSEAPLALIANAGVKASAAVAEAKKLKASRLLIRAEQFLSPSGTLKTGFVKSLGRDLKVLVTSDKMPFALTPAQLRKNAGALWLDGIICRAVPAISF